MRYFNKAILVASAALCLNLSVFAQDITLKTGNVTVKEAMELLKKSSGYSFVFSSVDVDTQKLISVSVQNANIEEAVKQILKGQTVFYEIQGRNIIVKKEMQQPTLEEKKRKISGTVKDVNGEPIIGATIQEKGTSNGTITDFDGNFVLEVSANGTVQISYIGYQDQEIPISEKSLLAITLKENSQTLEEVVVVGYGVQKKATLSGSVTSVGGEKLAKTPVTNLSQGIAGHLPGVIAVSNTSEPGYDGATITIRGVNTFGNSAPLIVVDGVPGRSLERIDPNTIETMSVLKDASAAIYGAQAANGVILITTKRGKMGKPQVNISFNYGISAPTVIPEMANSYEYATLMNEIDKYAGNKPRYSPDDLQLYQSGIDPWGHPNTDWFEETLKKWSPQTYANASIEGGTENVKYFASLSAKGQDAFYHNSGANYNQYDLRMNLDTKINKYIDAYINVAARMEDRKYPTRSSENIFRMLMRSKPNSPAYWPNGLPGPDIEFGDNPVVICTEQTGYDRDKQYILNGDFGLNIKIPYIEGLSLKATASLDKGFRFRKIWQKPWYLYSWDGTSMDSNGQPLLVEGKKGFSDPRLTESMEDNLGILLSGVANYSRTFAENHTVNVLAGVERITDEGDSFEAFRRYFLSASIDQLFAGGQDEMNNTGTGYKEARLNYFGRLNYAYKSKYLAEFVWRYQGSYIFARKNKFGFFPGISLGYVISEENFWKKHIPFISFAKIRASWGQTGNDLIDPYQYLSSYVFNDLMYLTNNGTTMNQALMESVAPNQNVTWETATQKNIGLDLHFFNGDLAFTIDYFHNKRTDILWKRNASVPGTSGLELPDENLGKVVNQGVDFNIDYRKKIRDLQLGINFNGVYARNKILYWDEAPGVPDYQKSTGRPIDSGLYYQAIGIFKDEEAIHSYPHWAGARPGDIIFKDVDENGVIDGNDRVRDEHSRTPRFTGGLTIDLAYKGFDLSCMFQGAFGGVFYQTTESGDFANFLKSFYNNRWTEDNPTASYPRTYNRSNEYFINQQNTFWLHKTNYIRMKNIELGYTIPTILSKKIGIENLRIYINAYNLLTFSPDMQDYDPENTSGSGYNYPLNKVINFGINLTF